MAVLLRIVDGVPCKELGRQTGGRPSPMEQLTTQVGNKEKVREKIRVRVWCHTRYENKTFYGCAPTVFYNHNFTAQTAVCELHLLTLLTVELSTRLGKACFFFSLIRHTSASFLTRNEELVINSYWTRNNFNNRI